MAPIPTGVLTVAMCCVAGAGQLSCKLNPRVTFHGPDEIFCRLLAFFLAGCGALHRWHGNANQLKRVRERGMGICVLAFLTFCDISSIALWMELDLALAARRAVASLSIPTEWLTLKAAISMTTPHAT